MTIVDKSITQKIIEIEKKITGHNHDKQITNSEFNNWTVKYFPARLAQANLVSLSQIKNHLLVKNKLK